MEHNRLASKFFSEIVLAALTARRLWLDYSFYHDRTEQWKFGISNGRVVNFAGVLALAGLNA